ncbi:uncharacterized protein LOC129002892 [Macrosteles quadrilineatus]|uniref:uncharacterized protein LOC129002886 n=1 Tax=Macrosteles quadrilineatus TaxID=74068 RepID=UPI0023E0F8B5|nr:uncharacterized protein LOC129002886 [Macrosteles quadrilineatus]XP_054286977.1 uncharacterized protein LOC129002892 [Macrosteles quadrilineatus]
MVRNYIRKTNRAEISEEAVKAALEDVKNGNMSIRQAAANHGLKKSMLHKRLKKLGPLEPGHPDIGPTTSNHGKSKYSHPQVFSTEEEDMLEDYLIQSSKLQYGLTYKQVRELAYDYGVKLERKLPISWETNKSAGLDWMKGYMKKHPRLSLRKPENTSIARNLNFNQHNVSTFFKNLEMVRGKNKFKPDNIINVDETGLTTVLESPKVVAPTGVKQIGQTVSAERGELVTVCGIVTAAGNAIPPVYIYPRVNMKSSFLIGAPNGSVGFASRTGWMNQDVFYEVIKHIAQHKLPTKENPILILLDNHESHISLNTIDYCRQNGIVLLTFPPHTSHKLQPLDVAVFAPFKSACKAAFNRWISSNPGTHISIYNIAHLSSIPFDEAFCRKNIISGFQKTGIEPFNQSVFTQDDFAPSTVTDRPNQQDDTMGEADLPSGFVDSTEENISQPGTSASISAKEVGLGLLENMAIDPVNLDVPDTGIGLSNDETVPGIKETIPKRLPLETLKTAVSPEQVRPFPRSERKKSINKGRKKGKSCVLTDTPEKNRIEQEVRLKLMKKEKAQCRSKRKIDLSLSVKKDLKKNKKNKILKPRDLIGSFESDSEEVDDVELCDDGGFSPFSESSDSEPEGTGEKVEHDGRNVNINDFVLVKLAGKKVIKYFVAQVSEKIGLTDFTVSFLKRKDYTYKFVKPAVDDESTIDISDIIVKLPQPNVVGGTERAISVFNFKYNFSGFNMG